MKSHLNALRSIIIDMFNGNVPPYEYSGIRIRDLLAAALYYSQIWNANKNGYALRLPDKVNIAYFTCGSHFRYLWMSIKSIELLKSRYIGDVVLFVDRTDPFSQHQMDELKRLALKIYFLKNEHVSGWGIRSLANQLKAYRKIANNMPDNYLLKLDSDTLLISDSIFSKLKGDCVGSPFQSRYHAYKCNIQGGAYFIGKRALEAITKAPLMNIALKIRPCPEDLAIHHLLSTNGRSIKFIKFHLPFRKFRIIKTDGSVFYDHKIRLDLLKGRKYAKRYPAVHFWMEKDKMRPFFESYFGVKCVNA
jgi:hypothetical protein